MRMSHNDEPAKMEEHDHNETNKIIPSSPQVAALKEELLSRIVPWEKITLSLHNFPYYIEEHTKSLLMECVASNLKHSKYRKYGARLKSSSERILLQTIPERLVSALAREMKVPLLKLDDDHGCGDEQGEGSDGEVSADDEVHNKVPTLEKGDRVKYVGETISIEEVNNRTLSNGQRGEVYEVNGERVAVVFNICDLEKKIAEEDERNTEMLRQALVTWIDAKDVEQDLEAQTHDCYTELEVFYEVLESQQPVIVYYPDSISWLPILDYGNEPFLRKLKRTFNHLPEGVVMICAENNWEAGLEKREEFPEPLKNYIERLQVPLRYRESEMHKLFTNVVCIKPPMVLEDHNLSCMDLEHPDDVEDMILTKKKVEKIVGWARNHYLSSCPFPYVNEEKLHIPHDSIKLAILRLKEDENQKKSKEEPKGVQDLACGCHEKSLVSAVVRSEDIGVKFDDVGALENVKKLMYETVILPMRRPELFSHGNLLRPCKGILLFGPPGTGKTLIAKALATESGANFIDITAATITSMWVGETEHLTRALFSYATKLAPVIIFVDEVDSLLGARGDNKYATSRLNEFMAAWDGLKSKESERILVIGTNRPYDLDEAVIRRMPRRIYVGLPDVENRAKIVKILLNKENIESGFSFEQLAEATDGYSGSDLKNLCVAAAYRPLEEFLEQESKGEACDGVPVLRPLNLNDFIQSKAKVRASVARNASSIIKLRKWKEKYGEGESQADNPIM